MPADERACRDCGQLYFYHTPASETPWKLPRVGTFPEALPVGAERAGGHFIAFWPNNFGRGAGLW